MMNIRSILGPAKGIFIVTILASALSCKEQSGTSLAVSPSDMDKYQLSAPVRSMKVRGRGKTVNDPNTYFNASFDSLGRIETVEYFLPDGQKSTKESYLYDSKTGLLKELREYDRDSEQSGIYFYTYNADGDMTRCWLMGMSSEEAMKWEHTIEGGRQVHTDLYIEGEIANRVDIKWLSDSVKIQYIHDSDGTLAATDSSTFLRKGKPLSIDSDGMHLRISYDEKGLPVSTVGVQLSPKGDFYWDESTTDDAVHIYSYEYDRHGNWTYRTEREEKTGAVLSKVTRKFRY